MGICTEILNLKTYKYNYSYVRSSLVSSKKNEYVYFQLNYRIDDNNIKIYFAETGYINSITCDLIPSNIKIGNIYIIDVTCPDKDLVNESLPQYTYYRFHFHLYNKDYTSYIEQSILCSVKKFGGYCQILNYFVSSDYDISDIDFSRLVSSEEYFDTVEPYEYVNVGRNLRFSDFIDLLYQSENKAYMECYYSNRYGEYAHIYSETLTFKTYNLVFAQILSKTLHIPHKVSDGVYEITAQHVEDTEYSGGMSSGIEEQGTFNVTSKGEFKKDLISKIINQTYKNFPSELDIICQMIKKSD